MARSRQFVRLSSSVTSATQISLALGLCLSFGAASVAHSPQVNPPVERSQSVDQRVQQGRISYQAGQYVQAIADWKQAEIEYDAKSNRANQALILSYLALAHKQIGSLSEASESIAKSLKLLVGTSHPRILAQVLNTQGEIQFTQGQVEAALTTWKQATALYTQLGEDTPKIGSLLNQVQAQQALGLLLQARQTLAEVERLLQRQSNSRLKAIALRSLGDSWLRVGNAARSRQFLEQSLKLSDVEADATLLSLGNAARSQQDTTAALAFYQRSNQPQALLNRFSLLVEMGQREQSKALIPEIQSRLSTLPLSRSTVYARINFSQSLIKLDSVAAAQTLAIALQEARKLGDRRAETYALGYLGQVYEQTQQQSEAQKLTEQALMTAQTIQAPEISYQWQWQLGRLLRAQGQTQAATQSYRLAFQSLQSIRSDLAASNPDLQFSFRERVEPVYREYVEVLLSSPTPAQENLKQARQVIESLRLAELDNFFRTACLAGKIVEIDSLKTQTQAAVVYPIILPDRIDIILSLPEQPLRHYTVQVAQSELETTLEELRQNLEKPITTPQGKQLGKKVYDWLIQPIAAELEQQKTNTLVFVLDGALRNVPIAALHDGQRYLIERYSVALSPGLQLLNPQPIQNQKLQAIAAGLTQERHGFSALTNVASELKELQAEVPSQILLNQAFTSAKLREQIQALPFPIVHLATHGQFSSNADETFILAWDKPIKVNELSLLLRDREDLQSQAIELLVLSACETAEGDKRAALGLAGVAVQAGARSTLASLWSLDDQSGARFIGQFYRELAKDKVSKAEALRQAQLSLLRDPNFRHPRYWAPYVLLGNWL
ncbi:CHAT domain-containing protein [Leptolyngbya sp. NIES-2104]|uniref:CHAT domain-containing protein n=1 Tax=Leptolyngbya sp. NIES-2104 TaxID=1552121 RepID=UPI0006ECAC9B|nr:CHAT domain-containing protein [Leptolyngbya sp. NIES-2104]GAP94316.1 putative hemagglutinin-related protein [Leptolyngbya sp. NIES-2104]